jgi:hypothetical protein
MADPSTIDGCCASGGPGDEVYGRDGIGYTVTTMEVMVRWIDEMGSHLVPYTLQTY